MSPSALPDLVVELLRPTPSALAGYAEVAIAFVVERVLEIGAPHPGELAGFSLSERAVEAPWRKDYDALESPGSGPGGCARFDLSTWWVAVARSEGRRVGGALLAMRTAGVDMLEGRADLGVLWDLRVAPDARGKGVASALLKAVEGKAREEGLRSLKVETQNVNVPACRFYAKSGFALGAIHRFAYPTLPAEVQLLWYKPLSPGGPAVLVLTGASGAGKTTLLRAIRELDLTGVATVSADEVFRAAPAPELAGEELQDAMLERALGHARTRTRTGSANRVVVVELQIRPHRAKALLTRLGLGRHAVVLVDCSPSERLARLEGPRGQPELATAQMDAWAAYLRGQADALGLDVVDTSRKALAPCVAEVVSCIDGLVPEADHAGLPNPESRWEPRAPAPPVSLLSGGLANTNIRVGAEVVRLYRRDPAAAAVESHLLRRPWRTFRVPRVLRQGEGILVLEYVDHGRVLGSPAHGAALGEALAEIHATRFAGAGDLELDAAGALRVGRAFREDDLVDALVGYAGRCLEASTALASETRTRVLRTLEQLAPRLREVAGPTVLLHGDFKPSNLHWTTDGRPLVLDWEFAYAGSALSDVGQLLRWGPPPRFVESFGAAYQAHRGKLVEDWPRWAAAFDLVNLAGLVVNVAAPGQRIDDVERRIERTVRLFES